MPPSRVSDRQRVNARVSAYAQAWPQLAHCGRSQQALAGTLEWVGWSAWRWRGARCTLRGAVDRWAYMCTLRPAILAERRPIMMGGMARKPRPPVPPPGVRAPPNGAADGRRAAAGAAAARSVCEATNAELARLLRPERSRMLCIVADESAPVCLSVNGATSAMQNSLVK